MSILSKVDLFSLSAVLNENVSLKNLYLYYIILFRSVIFNGYQNRSLNLIVPCVLPRAELLT